MLIFVLLVIVSAPTMSVGSFINYIRVTIQTQTSRNEYGNLFRNSIVSFVTPLQVALGYYT